MFDFVLLGGIGETQGLWIFTPSFLGYSGLGKVGFFYLITVRIVMGLMIHDNCSDVINQYQYDTDTLQSNGCGDVYVVGSGVCMNNNLKEGVIMKMLIKMLVLMVCLFVAPTPFVMAQDCEGNFDCDQDVDGTDAAVFKEDFGRSAFVNPCDTCIDSPCPCTAPGCDPPAPIAKTGQTTSYSTDDDGGLEKGVEWPNPRFTDNLDGTVTDNLTGLIWLKDASCFGQRTWSDALSDSNGLSSGSCGLTDGSSAGDLRLPHYKELFSLIDAENYDPALPTGHPFIGVEPVAYWSSTTRSDDPQYAWLVGLSTGFVSNSSKSNISIFVWPLRGGQ